MMKRIVLLLILIASMFETAFASSICIHANQEAYYLAGADSVTPFDETEHEMTKYYWMHCVDCGDFLEQCERKETAVHTFVSFEWEEQLYIRCQECGYQSKEVENNSSVAANMAFTVNEVSEKEVSDPIESIAVEVSYRSILDINIPYHTEEIMCEYGKQTEVIAQTTNIPSGSELVGNRTVTVSVDELGNASHQSVIFLFQEEDMDAAVASVLPTFQTTPSSPLPQPTATITISVAPAATSTPKMPDGLKWEEHAWGIEITDYTGSDTVLTIPERINGQPVVEIGNNAFRDCKTLTDVMLPNTLTSIGWGAFFDCDGLTNMTIPSNVTVIYSSAFRDCDSLTNVLFPNNEMHIEEDVFTGCDKLTLICTRNSFAWQYAVGYFIPVAESTNSIPMSAPLTTEYDAGDYRYKLYSNGDAVLTNYVGTATHVKVPNTIAGHQVVAIGKKVFDEYCTSVISVTIPKGVTLIGACAFQNCPNLIEVTLPNGVTAIGDEAFHYCRSLTKVMLPDTVTHIGWGAFRSCDSLTDVSIPNGITTIRERTFAGCTSLMKMTIPRSVTTIGERAFDGCKSLNNVTIPNGLREIGEDAFRQCYSLTNLTIPESVSVIGASAFEGCESLTNVIIQNGLTEIRQDAFRGCYALHDLTIPNSVETIGNGAFTRCGLKKVMIPNSVTTIGSSAFEGCNSLTDVTIPDSVVLIGMRAFFQCPRLTNVVISGNGLTIGNLAFSRCDSLTNVTIQEGVTIIGASAFQSCSALTSVTLPEGVTTIESGAFSYCDSLTNMIIPDSVTAIEGNIFFLVNPKPTITCSRGSYVWQYAKENDIPVIAR